MSDPKDRDDGDSSLAETLPGKTRSPYARKAAEERRRMGMADTLPKGVQSPATAETPPMGTPVPDELRRGGTFPPVVWDREDIISSTAPRTGDRADSPAPGGVHSAVEGVLGEEAARTILTARFTTAGYALEVDYAFQQDDLAVTLDGFDPARRVGFAYLSHADADVVTDFDEATELAFQQYAADGVAQVLVVHDADTPNVDVLERRIDAFFAALARDGGGDSA